MAEDADNEDKTFEASPRRREEARQQGRYAFSQDLASSALTLAGVVGLMQLGPYMGGNLLEVFRFDFANLRFEELTNGDAQQLFAALFARGLMTAGGFLAVVFIAAFLVSVVQAGFHITPERLTPNFDKFNPAEGIKKIFSTANVVKGILAVIKVIVLSWVAYTILSGRSGTLLSLGHDSLPGAVTSAWKLTMRVALVMSAVIFALGVVDFFYQYRRFEAGLRMTREEFEREHKEEEGDPQMKHRRRQIARDRIRRKMLAAVPKSTVVITNPTHYAVALRYEQGRDTAPKLVAKGSGAFARRVAQVAREHGVPVLERPELARALFAAVKEDQEVPPGLFLAVAEVIAFVYRLRGMVRQ
jgi:flagellar biosynthetic protein FlhB